MHNSGKCATYFLASICTSSALLCNFVFFMLCSRGIGSENRPFCLLDIVPFMVVWLHGIAERWFRMDREVQNLHFLTYKHTQNNDNRVNSSIKNRYWQEPMSRNLQLPY